MLRCRGFTLMGKRCNKKSKQNELCFIHQNQLDCPICMDALFGKPMKCGHIMHTECMKGLRKMECPLCRDKLTELSQEMEKIIISNIEKDRIERLENEAASIETNGFSLEEIMYRFAIFSELLGFFRYKICNCARCMHNRQEFAVFHLYILDENYEE